MIKKFLTSQWGPVVVLILIMALLPLAQNMQGEVASAQATVSALPSTTPTWNVVTGTPDTRPERTATASFTPAPTQFVVETVTPAPAEVYDFKWVEILYTSKSSDWMAESEFSYNQKGQVAFLATYKATGERVLAIYVDHTRSFKIVGVENIGEWSSDGTQYFYNYQGKPCVADLTTFTTWFK